ncbi:hypothetical protein Lal_00036894 [Lupinus albus]|uniref:Uncharacterized protein n=1 Tax=Lupinus albus TaxID=3870 RepID=A0A6A4PU74_LUPAL|nr:putative protein kinase RLK-Pelle-CrRLK1L-1 family [Lupinus albus]KAF1888852.1 hypothetical protein Lal_00036894 [Lupinus albus]
MVSFRQNNVHCTNPSSIINLFFFFFFLLLPYSFLLQPLFTMQVSSYNPIDDFAVNCGSIEDITFQNRTWVGDKNSILFAFSEPQNEKPSFIAKPIDLSSISSVPLFDTARFSNSEFTYSFHVSDGPKFIRFHFYPNSYSNTNSSFESYNSLFSVKVDNFTLLKDFNASLWLPKIGEKTFFLEYCINVGTDQNTLNLTFFPSTNSYAFINGIEVVSMPPFLYYTNVSVDLGFPLVGHGSSYHLENNKALETRYRINVGNTGIQPSEDTGMFRNWDSDINYILKQYNNSVSSGFGLQLNYKGYPDYIAPANVYLTARNYGKNPTENYNVTWNFEVDTEFLYMVRLHFCEFVKNITKVGDRVFQIFIDDTLVEGNADLMEWSGGNRLVPIHKDYALLMLNKTEKLKKHTLSIKLQRVLSGYSDVILNGIEIFKISDGNSNLAGPNPDPVSSPPQILQPLNKTSKNITKRKVVIIAVVVVSCLVLVSLLGSIIIFMRRKRGIDENEEKSSWKSKNEGSTLPSHLCRYFTIGEIRASTHNFDEVFIIGIGGFGNVYKGYIDGATPVAIKRLKPGSQQGENEFMNEIEMLSQLRHLHLVSLIGYCNENSEMILVYDFMHRGTLHDYLYNTNHQPLPWKQRLNILLGSARGLHYLHSGAKHNIIHRDVKSTNILLDEKWVAKVSDFGLSKVGPSDISMTHVSTVVKGSIGYFDPEYYKRQRLTLKSDVYSFGVVLLEVLCARPPLLRNVEKYKVSLVDWVTRCYEMKELHQTVDPFLKGTMSNECLKSYGELALSCLHENGNQRPSMHDVVGGLEFVLNLVESEEDIINKFSGTQQNEKNDEKPLLPLSLEFMGDEGSGVCFTNSDESGSTKLTNVSLNSEEQAFCALVFSEIGNPNAR